MEIAKAVDGVEVDRDQAKIALLRVPDSPGVAASLFGEISTQKIDVDLIIQSIHEGNTNDIAFTVVNRVLKAASAVAEAIAPALRTHPRATEEAEVIIDQRIAKVAISGAGMIGRPGIAAKMFKTLADARINIQMISTSEVKVSCVIDEAECDRALRLLSLAFDIDLDSQPEITPRPSKTNHPPVRGVALDTNQARIAIRHVPDTPGMAAQIFTLLARKNISVDAIIQSQRCHLINDQPTRDIAFTVAQADAEVACEVITELDRQINCGQVSGDTAIAKLSVVGAGMIGHPGVAAKFFAALAQENINIQMITTSEIKISCVIDEADGVKALKAVHEAFGLGGNEQITIPT
jgi:aspartate kinase